MIKLFYHPSPNPLKVVLFLEEANVPYEIVPVDTKKGEQFSDGFKAINPNTKVPAIADGETIVFDSSAILLYLAEKTDKFLGPASERGELLSWLCFAASGLGPYIGQAAHFRHQAPEPKEYALNRYAFEADRHYGIVNERLATRRYMMGDTYTILDMSVVVWARIVGRVCGDDAWPKYPHLRRHLDDITARPAFVRADLVKDRYAFKTEMDAEARNFLYPHTVDRGVR